MMTRRGLAIGGSALLLSWLSERSEGQERNKRFLVYFRWRSVALRPNMEKLVFEAAQSAKYHKSALIEVTGYTDLSMSDAESRDISARMAKAVADELVKHGVAPGAIVVRAMGEESPLKHTADGVIEPRNRRVEVVIK